MTNEVPIGEQLILIQPTVVLGLGEVGRRSVAYLKRRIYEAYGPLDTVMLLSLTVKDEDPEAEARKTAALPYELLPSEHIALDLKDAYMGAQNLKKRFTWLPEGVFGRDRTDYGARAASRLAFMVAMSEMVAPFLQENLRRILGASERQAMTDKGFQVATQGAAIYIATALDDPAGSGLLLDVAYLTRELLRNIGPVATTTGILFLPEPQTLDETRGANVYAALKELDYHMSGNRFQQAYTSTISVDTEIPPFSHGLYLVDTINEKQVALGDRDEASAMLGEWLFQAALSRCKPAIDGAIAGASGRQQRVEGRLAEYGSLGLSGYILPIESFVDWCANKLGDDILQKYVRGNESRSLVAQQISDFENTNNLPPPQFKENVLRAKELGQVSANAIDALEATSYASLEARIRSDAQSFEKNGLPSHARLVTERATAYQNTAAGALKEEQNTLLNHPTNANHISLALNFFNDLQGHLKNYQRALEAQEVNGQGRVSNLVRDVNKNAGMLFRSLSTVPQSLFDFALILLGLLVAFLVPLFLVARLILSLGVPANAGFGYFLLFLLLLSSFGIVGFTIWQIRGRIHSARNDFFNVFRQYVDARIDHTNTKAALTFYPSVIQATDERKDELMTLFHRVTGIRNDCAQASDNTEALVGEVDFPLQRSLLTDDFIQSEYARLAGNLDEKYPSFLTQVGTPAKWLKLDSAELQKRIMNFGREVFKPLRNHTINNLLERAPNEAIRKQKVMRSAQELLDKAAPMWTYNQFTVGQDLAGAGHLSSYGLLAMEDPSRSNIDDEYQTMKADLKTIATRDPYRLQIVKLRQGYPLYGLRAFNDFRKHYIEALRAQEGAEGTVRPLHIADDYLLSQDPLPYPPNLTLPASIDTIFAVGLVAGAIGREDGGPYEARPDGQKSRPLATTPERSVALLSTDPELAAQLANKIYAWVEGHFKEEVIGLLEKATEVEDIRPWQAAAIDKYILQLKS